MTGSGLHRVGVKRVEFSTMSDPPDFTLRVAARSASLLRL